MTLKPEKLDEYLSVIDRALLVVGTYGNRAYAKDPEVLRDLRAEIREAILVRNQSVQTVVSCDDENRVEPQSEGSLGGLDPVEETPDRAMHNAFRS